MVRRTSYYRAFNFSFFFSASRFIQLCTFIVFGFTGDVLTAEKAFLVASMFNTVRLSMTLFFPFAISQIGEAKVSIKRIQDFLMLQERDKQLDTVLVNKTEMKEEDKDVETVNMENVSGKWNSEETELTLNDVNVSCRTGNLLAVIGSVGSGKSSIIQAILGEFPSTKGKINVRGKLSYSPQEAWVFSGSIRQNILFGLEFDKGRYWKVIEACALKHDLDNWEFGDRTLVGERGVSLSGGQKARVSLARAIYRKADTYLLDDPLSAVDVHVGRHLFNNCIRGFLKSKAVILVTHQLQYLQDADEIIVMKSGRIEDKGTFQHLVKHGMDFSSFLAEEEEDEVVEQDDKIKRDRTMSIRSDSDNFSLMAEQSQVIMQQTSMAIRSIPEDENDEAEAEKKQEDPKQVKEQRSSGSVKASVYTKYFTSGGGIIHCTFLILMNIICQALYSGSDIWLSYWTTKEELKILAQNSSVPELEHLPAPSITSTDNYTIITDLYEEDYYTEHFFNLGIYAAIVLGLVVTSMIRTVHFFYVCMKSSVKLHDYMFSRILRAPCRFFDTNPVGKEHILLSILDL